MSGIERNPAAWGGTKYSDPDAKVATVVEPVYRAKPVYPCSSCKHGIAATQDYWTVEGKNLCSVCFEARYPGWRASWGKT